MKQIKTKTAIIVVSAIVVALLVILGVVLIIISSNSNASNDNSKSNNNISMMKIGDTITCGKYEQDNDNANGLEPIEWQIIDVKDNKALVISCNVLDCRQFNEDDSIISWSDSSLRKWLNSEFFETAFSNDEKSSITLTEVSNYGSYEGYDASGSWLLSNTKSDLDTVVAESPDQENTQDYVFLLNIDEVNQYFATDEDRKAFLSNYGTEVFIKLGIEQANQYNNANEESIRSYYESSAEQYGKGFCNWWLRSPGLMQSCAAAVDYSGVTGQSMTVSTEDGGVRPAMWIVIR